MSQTPEQDKARQRFQLGVAMTLVIASMIFPFWYVWEKGILADDELVKTIVIGFWTLVVAGAGMAYSIFGLGRKVT